MAKKPKTPPVKKEPVTPPPPPQDPTGELHVKPTVKDLDDQVNNTLKDLEAMKNDPPKPADPPTPPKADDPPPKPPKADDPPADPPKADDPPADPPKELTEEEKVQQELDAKDKKLKASSREAQILYQRNKEVQQAIEKASELPAPTEEELKVEYGDDWEIMSDFEKKMATESMANKKRMDEITKVNSRFKDLEEWQKKVDTYIDDPATIANNPALDGIEDDFKIFATKPTRRGVDFDMLVSSFLYQYDEKPARPKKSQMFPTGSGGGHEKPEPLSDKITVEEGRILRETNYPEYKKLLIAGKIKTDDF